MSTIIDQDLNLEFVKSHYFVKDIHDHHKVIGVGVGVGGLYKLNVTRKGHQALAYTTMSIEVLWHQRYGHLNYHDLLLLHK